MQNCYYWLLSANIFSNKYNKKHLKNVGPIRHCEPPHVDVHNNNNDYDNDNVWQWTAMAPLLPVE